MVGIKRASVSAALLLSIAERTMANPVDIEDLMLRGDDMDLLEAREVASDLDHLLLQLRDLEIRNGVEHDDPSMTTRGWVRSVFGEGLEEREIDTIVDTMVHLRDLESRQSSPVLASESWTRDYAEELDERDFEDFEERDLEDLEERDFDVEERDYYEEMEERDLEDLEERDYYEEMEERYFEELDERDEDLEERDEEMEERDEIDERDEEVEERDEEAPAPEAAAAEAAAAPEAEQAEPKKAEPKKAEAKKEPKKDKKSCTVM